MLPKATPHFGAVAGVPTALFAYPVGTILVIVALAWPRSDDLGLSVEAQVIGSIGGGLLVGGIAFLLTFWVTLPVGAAGGYPFERVRTSSLE